MASVSVGDIEERQRFFSDFIEKKDWLPEIYAIGVRNPQGITISPHDDEIYFSSHGPRGGDHIGEVEFGSNYGWKDIAWAGREY